MQWQVVWKPQQKTILLLQKANYCEYIENDKWKSYLDKESRVAMNARGFLVNAQVLSCLAFVALPLDSSLCQDVVLAYSNVAFNGTQSIICSNNLWTTYTTFCQKATFMCIK